MSSAQTRFPFSDSGTSPATMRCASPSTIAVLPTPGSPIRTGLFFVRRESTWITRRISSSRPMTGSSFPLSAASVRSRPNFESAWYVPSGSDEVTRRPAVTSAIFAKQLVARHDVEREQEVLRRDVLVLHPLRLVEGAVEHLRELRADLRLLLRALDAGLLRERRLGLRAQRVHVGDELARQLLVEEREQQMLGIELRIPVPARELLRRRDGLLRLDRELVEIHQAASSQTPNSCSCAVACPAQSRFAAGLAGLGCRMRPTLTPSSTRSARAAAKSPTPITHSGSRIRTTSERCSSHAPNTAVRSAAGSFSESGFCRWPRQRRAGSS